MAMSREQIMREYEVRSGYIRSPGKMEGNPIWVPALWDQTMEGGQDDTVYDGDTTISVFHISKDDTDEFPELAKYKVVTLYEDTQGFVQWDGYKTEADWHHAEQQARESEGPNDEDLVTEDGHTFYEHGTGHKVLKVDPDASRREVWAELEAHFEREQFWPNVWMERERGGYDLFEKK